MIIVGNNLGAVYLISEKNILVARLDIQNEIVDYSCQILGIGYDAGVIFAQEPAVYDDSQLAEARSYFRDLVTTMEKYVA